VVLGGGAVSDERGIAVEQRPKVPRKPCVRPEPFPERNLPGVFPGPVTHTHTHTQTHTHTHTSTHTIAHTHTYTHAHTHTQTHTNTNTHTHTRFLSLSHTNPVRFIRVSFPCVAGA